MTTPENDKTARSEDAFLDALFDTEKSARDAVPDVSPELLARVLADAEAEQDRFASQSVRSAPVTRKPGLLQQIGAALGGWPAMAGLVAASVCGLWLGISPPDGLSDMASLYLTDGDTLLDPLSGFDLEFGEG